jgi:hypothetical protein
MSEYFTTVRAEVYITLRSERELTKQEVYEVLSETNYEFGTDEGVGLEDGESVHISRTVWEDNEITHMNRRED